MSVIATLQSPRPMAPTPRTKKQSLTSSNNLQTALLFILIFTFPVLILLRTPPLPPFTTPPTSKPWSGDLREAEFAWNRLAFAGSLPPPSALKLAVFSRKWPVGAAPGGMERHALTLHAALARRGHQVHVYTSGSPKLAQENSENSSLLQLHFPDGPNGQWRPKEAWALFEAEHQREPFDVVHSESVALPHSLARNVPSLAVSWHGIALESVGSSIYQDLARRPSEPMPASLNKSLSQVLHKVVNEIRFFGSYAHHVAISDSSGEMLRDVYQIPNSRVHVILNGVDEREFGPDASLGRAFRAQHGVPRNASLVLGVSGRLVKDKGHPLLHEAFSKLMSRHPDVHLIVAGSGPWEQRYRDLGRRVIALGALPPAHLRAFYNSIDVFVNPTLRPQGLDLTLMEAMQCGKPILATRFPSIKGSIVVDEEFGHMFAPNVESLLEGLEVVVAEGPERLASRGRACRQYAASMFTANKMALAYERLFLCIKNETFCNYP
ncbi:hypothetical protein ACLOJK_008830 [Asimina triloba]